MKPMGTRYEIYRGKEIDGKLVDLRTAGYAYINNETDYYVVKLFLLPRNTYFLSKNRNTQTGYTIFAKAIDDKAGVRFQNPVGHGRLMENVKTHLSICFPDLSSQMFMSLFPKETHPQDRV